MSNAPVSQTALITGASSGIGLEFAKILAQKGYNLVLVSNEGVKLKKIQADLEKQYSISVTVFDRDLALPAAALELYEKCQSAAIPIDILINNAGFFFFGEATEASPDKARDMIQVHMLTPSLLCTLFGKDMKARRQGYILNVSSISAYKDFPYISYYGATKRYIKSFSRSLHTEMKDHNVGVTCLCPGATATNLFDPTVVDYKKAKRFGLMMEPSQVAQIGIAALFRKKACVIPGALNKIMSFLAALMPHWLILVVKRWVKIG